MLALLDQTQEPITPAEEVIARQAVAKLAQVAEANQDIKVRVEGAADILVPLPAKIVRMMLQILEAMSEGKPVSVIPHEAELTTKQAADFLNVSRPHVCTLIDDGKLPARLVGRHRRIKFADLLEYERLALTRRNKALERMHERAEKLGLNDLE